MTQLSKAIVTVSLIVASTYLVSARVFQGQQPPAQPNSKQTNKQKDEVLELESGLMAIDVIVTDAAGNFVRDLKQGDFQILEDNQPEKIEFFDKGVHAEERPLAAVFALDRSGSIEPDKGQVMEQQESAKRFMELLDEESEFAVVAFNNEIKILQNFTNDHHKISQAFEKAAKVEGTTKIYDAVDRSITMLKKVQTVKNGRRIRRVVIVVTDGYDSSSTINLQELLRRANDANVTIYSITIPNYMPMMGGKQQRALTLLDLSELIPHTGGMDYSADTYDFTPIFKSIKEELAASYTVAYYPSATSRGDGKFHSISVKISKPGVRIRLSRQGFSGPDVAKQK